MFNKLLRAPQVAQILDVPLARVFSLIREDILPATHIGRQVRVDEEALREFIKSGGKALPGVWKRVAE